MKLIKHKIEYFITGIKNLIKWFFLIWNDRDFDKNYILNILIFKLENTRECLRKNSSYKDDSEEVKTITECIELFKKINDDWYYYDFKIKEFEKKWTTPDFDFIKIENSNLYKLIDLTEKDLTSEQIEKRKQDYTLCVKESEELRNKDFTRAMEIFQKNYDIWWT